MIPLTDDDLAAMQARADAATQLAATYDYSLPEAPDIRWAYELAQPIAGDSASLCLKLRELAAARTDLDRLIAEVRRRRTLLATSETLQAENAKLTEQVGELTIAWAGDGIKEPLAASVNQLTQEKQELIAEVRRLRALLPNGGVE